MRLEKPGIISIMGLVLSIIGLYLFLGLDTSPVLIPSGIQFMPIIGGIILGIGFSLMFFERNLITTLVGFIVFLAMSLINWISAGFAFGLLIPGLFGKGKNLPVYTAAGVLLVGTIMLVSQNPGYYQNNIMDQIVNITYENMGSLQNNMNTLMEQQVEAMIPTQTQINQLVESMLPCNNQTYQEQCLKVRQEIANQMYEQTHSPQYKQELLSKLPKIQISRDQIKEILAQMPLMKVILDNIQYVISLITVGWFLLYTLSITIPQGILDFFLGFIPKKEEKEEDEKESKDDETEESKVW